MPSRKARGLQLKAFSDRWRLRERKRNVFRPHMKWRGDIRGGTGSKPLTTNSTGDNWNKPLQECTFFKGCLVLEAKGELKLLDRLREEAPEGLTSKFDELSQIDEPNSTIIHGDCWNNNFMFKYDERNKSKPSAVKFLDFQLIQAAPLVYDLSYHIYATASETELKEFQALLRVYHNSLSTCLNQLGFSSDKLFPMSELEKQWKKYSIFGVVMASMAMPFALADKTDAVDFASNDEHNQLKNMFEQIKKKKFNLFAPRIVAALRHHYGFSDGDYIVAA